METGLCAPEETADTTLNPSVQSPRDTEDNMDVYPKRCAWHEHYKHQPKPENPDVISTRLPNEILSQIFDQLDRSHWMSWEKDHDSLCFLNKRLLPFARRIILRDVRLTRLDQLRPFVRTMTSSRGQHVGPSVESLSINLENECRRDHHWTPSDLLPFFRHLTQLRKLNLRHSMDFVVALLSKDVAQSGVLRNLHTLSIFGTTSDDANPYQRTHYSALSLYPSLATLSLAFTVDEWYPKKTGGRTRLHGEWFNSEELQKNHGADGRVAGSDYGSDHGYECQCEMQYEDDRRDSYRSHGSARRDKGYKGREGWNRDPLELPTWIPIAGEDAFLCSSLTSLTVGEDEDYYDVYSCLARSGNFLSLFPQLETLFLLDLGSTEGWMQHLPAALGGVSPLLKDFSVKASLSEYYIHESPGFHLALPLLQNIRSLTLGDYTFDYGWEVTDETFRLLKTLQHLRSLTLVGWILLEKNDQNQTGKLIMDLVRPSTKPPKLEELHIDWGWDHPRRGQDFGQLNLDDLPSEMAVSGQGAFDDSYEVKMGLYYGWKLPHWAGNSLEDVLELKRLADSSGVALIGNLESSLEVLRAFEQQSEEVAHRRRDRLLGV